MSKDQKRRRHTKKTSILIRSVQYAGVTIFILCAALLVAGLTIWLLSSGDRSDRDADRETETIQVAESEESVESVEQIPEALEDNEYKEDRPPMPEYTFTTEEITVPIKGLQDSYRIAFVNDVHIITDRMAGDVLESNLVTIHSRYDTLAVTDDGVHAEELWPEIIKYLNYNEFDAVIFGGDILDYSSSSNFMELKSGIESLMYPKERIMYLRSDHDYGGWYGGNVYTDNSGFAVQTFILDGDKGENYIDFGEFLILGINKSYQNLSSARAAFLNGKLDEGKPTIIATHVPFYSMVDSSLEEKSMEVRNKIYYWNPKNSGYIPDDRTQQFIDRMYSEDSNVVQIVAGHLHASWDGLVTENIREHIFSPTFRGSIGIINVVPGE